MDEKKQNELAILKEALQRARSNGGEARRNADKLAGEIHPLRKAGFCYLVKNRQGHRNRAFSGGPFRSPRQKRPVCRCNFRE